MVVVLSLLVTVAARRLWATSGNRVRHGFEVQTAVQKRLHLSVDRKWIQWEKTALLKMAMVNLL